MLRDPHMTCAGRTRPGFGGGGVVIAGDDNVNKLAEAMYDADFVLIDGVMFETEYLRVPDEYTVADDVVLEAKRGSDEVAFTREDVDDAEALGDGVYRLKSGALLRFLTSATVH